jgi:hypothetical protein
LDLSRDRAADPAQRPHRAGPFPDRAAVLPLTEKKACPGVGDRQVPCDRRRRHARPSRVRGRGRVRAGAAAARGPPSWARGTDLGMSKRRAAEPVCDMCSDGHTGPVLSPGVQKTEAPKMWVGSGAVVLSRSGRGAGAGPGFETGRCAATPVRGYSRKCASSAVTRPITATQAASRANSAFETAWLTMAMEGRLMAGSVIMSAPAPPNPSP